MASNRCCVICECSSGVMKPVLESLVPTSVSSPTGKLKDVWTIFIEMLTNSEDESLNQICIDCFGEIQRTYYFVDKCEKSQLKINKAVPKTVENSNRTLYPQRSTNTTIVHEFPENLRLPMKLNRSNSFPELRNNNHEKDFLIEQEVTQALNESNGLTESRNKHPEEMPLIEVSAAGPDTETNASTTAAGEEVEILWTFTVNPLENKTSDATVNAEPVCSTNNEIDIPFRHTKKSFEQPSVQPSEQLSDIPSREEKENEKMQSIRTLRSRKANSARNQKKNRDVQNGKENSNLNDSHQFTCAICLKHFRSKHNLRVHLLSLHAAISCFECRSCLKIFRSETKLKLHMNRVHSTIKHECNICSKVFNNVKLLLTHLKNKTCKSKTRPKFKCSKCLENFDSKSNLSQHILTHNNLSYKCKFCSKQYPNEGKLNVHQLCHSNDRTFDCYKCSKTFKYPQSLREHIKVAHPELKQRCEICLQMFENMRQLQLHTAQLHKYKCNICAKYFALTSSLDEHIQQKHPCGFCGDKFHSYPDFKKHMQAGQCIPGNKKDCQCLKCWKIFGRRVDLNRHLVIHSGNRSFKCDRCTLAFGRKDSLNRHEKKCKYDTEKKRNKTGGNRSFKCDRCTLTFGRKNLLNRHERKMHV